jgi:glycosyltransferase involved in cell wall biosynthesis
MAPKIQKTIWLINQYASTPETGMGGRHYYLAKELAKQGHKVYLIAASFTHLLRESPKLANAFKIEEIEGFQFVWVKVPSYKEAHSKKRVFNWFKFAWQLLKLPKVIADKPDVILASSPAPFIFWGAQRLAIKFGARLAFEVRDIWPLTLMELGGYSSKHPLIKLMQWTEDKAYRDADVVLSNLPYTVDHMMQRGMVRDKFTWVPNGFDQSEVSKLESLPESVLALIPQDKFVVGYIGSMGVANALDSLIEAAESLQNQSDIIFILVGNGQEKINLMKKSDFLSNVIFIDPIKKTQIQTMLAQFDVCFIGWQDEPLYRFGISPNKLPEYMLSEKPILHAFSGEGDAVAFAKAGKTVLARNPERIAGAVLKLKALSPEQRNQMGQNGREYALKNYDYVKLAEKLANVLLGEQ